MSSLTKGTVRIQVRKDTAANWTSTDPVLGNGEFGLESDVGNYKLKIGTGTTAWTSLPYLGNFKVLDGDGTVLTIYQGKTWTLTEGTGIDVNHTDVTGDGIETTITCDLEGTELLSTGETGTAKFLRIDGDDSCSWQVPPTGGSPEGTAVLSTGETGGYVLTADGSNAATWEVSSGGGGFNSIIASMVFG